jgi:hypothetical protein
MNKVKKLSAIATALLTSALASNVALAEKVQYQVESFTGVSVGTGMVAMVSCGSSNQTTLISSDGDLENINVSVEDGQLTVERKSSMSKVFNDIFSDDNNASQTIKVEIVTSAPLTLIQGSTGSNLTVESCAIDSNQLQVEGGTGASINVAGSTAMLDLELSTGGTFNRKNKADFIVAEATVDLSTGAAAYLCQAERVTGSGSTGATLYTAAQAETNEVSLSIGAEVIKNRCK